MSALQQANKSPLLIWLLSCAVFLSLLNSASAEIYVSTNVDGIQKWSTQAVDGIFIKSSIVENLPLRPTASVTTKAVDAKPTASKSKIPNATQFDFAKQ